MLIAVAAVALGQALQLVDPRRLSLLFLTAALVAGLLAVLLPASWLARPRAARATTVVLGVGVLAQLIELAVTEPALYAAPASASILLGAAATTAAVVIGAELAGAARFAAL